MSDHHHSISGTTTGAHWADRPDAEGSSGPAAASADGGAGDEPLLAELVADEPLAIDAPPPARDQSESTTLDTVITVMPSWLISLLVHMVILILLAVSSFTLPRPQFLEELTFGTAETTSEEPDFLESPQFSSAALSDDRFDSTNTIPSELIAALPEVNTSVEPVPVNPLPSFNPLEAFNPVAGEMTRVGGVQMGESLKGRSAADKLRLLREGGGTEGSEAAVQNALLWIKNHQLPHGNWSFQLLHGGCNCPNPGLLIDSFDIASTAMALLPFLGAGHTHQE